ncbi:hypothetical protein BSKO_04240 [Bryopsis sp. KO-2023]|nr:hypothetical protein BSKO_04240 [Bryopsis sp. KO-2023]
MRCIIAWLPKGGSSGRTAAQAPAEPYTHRGNVYIKHHCHTHTYDRNQSHSIRTTLHMPWRLGMNGVPPPHTNLRGFCGELDDELSHINATLKSVQEKLGVLEDEDEKASDLMEWSSIHKRRNLTKSVANQMEFFTQRMNEWSHNTDGQHEVAEASDSEPH